jgi:predicted transcriptional regulator
MKEVLTSVNKEHLDNILDGIKTIEWRKKPLPLGKHYGYETKNKGGCGKVTGDFEVVENIKVGLFEIVCDDEKDLIKKGCVDWGFLNKYAGKQDYLYANIIENARRYDNPKELSEFEKPCNFKWECSICERYNRIDRMCIKAITRPPQSWCYVEVE